MAKRSGLRALLVGLMTLPDDRQGMVPAVVRAVWPFRRDVDLVYSTAPCFSAHLAGRALRGITGSPWYAEFRDPWIGNASRKKDGSALVGRLDRWLERFCLRAATGIVTVSPRAAEAYRTRYAALKPQVLCALNGLRDVRSSRGERRPGPLRVVYAGSVYPPRNPTALVEALKAAWKSIDERLALEFTFVGADGWQEAPGLELATQNLPSGMSVQRLPWLPQEEARALVDHADLLLLPAQQWHLQIPNKLYDYLASRVPVFALAERDSDTADMLRDAGGHHVGFTDAGPQELELVARAALRAALAYERAGKELVMMRWRTAEQLNVLVSDVVSGTESPDACPQVVRGA